MSKGGCAGINKCNADILVFLMSTIAGDLIYRPFFLPSINFSVLEFCHMSTILSMMSIVLSLSLFSFCSPPFLKEPATYTNK